MSLRGGISRILSFLENILFRRVYARIFDHALEKYPSEILFYDVAKFVVFNQVEGDYLEFGVYQGEGFSSMYKKLKYHWKSFARRADEWGHSFDQQAFGRIRFVAFDSFQGLPDTRDPMAGKQWKKGMFACSEQEFKKRMLQAGIPESQLVLVPGWYDQTLSDAVRQKTQLKKAAVIFIDCDLYESSVSIFRFIRPLVHDGTVIILDDYFRYRGHPQRGVRGAFYEWLQSCPDLTVSELGRCSANRIAFVCHC